MRTFLAVFLVVGNTLGTWKTFGDWRRAPTNPAPWQVVLCLVVTALYYWAAVLLWGSSHG